MNTSQPVETIRVAIVLGSDSDWEVMESCRDQLAEFGLRAEINVLSAHRTPDDLGAYVKQAEQRGVAVFIAGAGMSAALAGTIAAHTTRPVIGVPLDTGALGGIDALLSTVQMPPGVPVAGMAVGGAGAKNAAILAVQILALSDPGLAHQLAEFKRQQAAQVREKNRKLQENFLHGDR